MCKPKTKAKVSAILVALLTVTFVQGCSEGTPTVFKDYTISSYIDKNSGSDEDREYNSHMVRLWVKEKGIDENSVSNYESCLSNFAFVETKIKDSEKHTVEEGLGWCKKKSEKTPKKFRKMINLNDCFTWFDYYDGSHYLANAAIKDGLNDPGSFEHKRTEYWLQLNRAKPRMVLQVVFRAKNGFGALVLGEATVEYDINSKTANVLKFHN